MKNRAFLDVLYQSVFLFYQSLALHECDLSPEVSNGHSNGFPIETIRGVPHESNPVSQHTDVYSNEKQVDICGY